MAAFKGFWRNNMKNIYTIRELRKQQKISETKAAAALGISIDQYRSRETNPKFITFGEIEKLANLFGVSFNELFELVHLQMEGFTGGKKC